MTEEDLGLIIVAAGAATRMGGIDKVWVPLAGHPVIWHAIVRLGPSASSLVVVVRPDQIERAQRELAGLHPKLTIVPGGDERQESVARGLHALDPTPYVAVHDAARPLAPTYLLVEGLRKLDRFEGAIPVQPVHDTIKHVDSSGRVTRTLDRASLRAAQTPQLFRGESLRSAHRAAAGLDIAHTDDAGLLERDGRSVTSFPGSTRNVKITTRDDLLVAESFLAAEGS